MSDIVERLRSENASDIELEAANEIERLRDIKRTCECSLEDQCMFARERDEALEEVGKLKNLLGRKVINIEKKN